MSDSDNSPVPAKKRRLNRESPTPQATRKTARTSKVVLSSSQFDDNGYSDSDRAFISHNDDSSGPPTKVKAKTKPVSTTAKTKKPGPSRKGDQALQELRRRNAELLNISSEVESPAKKKMPREKAAKPKPAKPAKEKQPKPKKSKHRIIVHNKSIAELEDLVATQLPDDHLSSSPWRQRGAIIQKKPARDTPVESAEGLYSWSPSPPSDQEDLPVQSSPPIPASQEPETMETGTTAAGWDSGDHTGVGRGSRAQSMHRSRSKSAAEHDDGSEEEDDAFSTFISKSQRALQPNPSKGNMRYPSALASLEYGWEREVASQNVMASSQKTCNSVEADFEVARATTSPGNFSDSLDDEYFDITNESFDINRSATFAASAADKPLVMSQASSIIGARSLASPLPKAPLALQLPSSPHGPIARALSFPDELAGLPEDAFDEDDLGGLPSDAFDDDDEFARPPAQAKPTDVVTLSSQVDEPRDQQRLAPKKNLQQRTLFGDVATTRSGPGPPASTQGRQLSFLVDKPLEPHTHHDLAEDGSMDSWIFPTNLGSIRDYQYNIVGRGLFSNTLVALPTGLGKTFIAAAVMLNWYRWTKTAQIFFVAPTKPLVSQQVEACFGIAGIPKSDTSLLTGNVVASLRREEYARKRVFFMTPQTLVNDLKSGNADPKRVVLLVIDEAHRATGAYAYVELVRFIRQFNKSFRVLALTATPGASVEAVQAVMDGLHISKVEIRHESSLDIRDFVYERRTDVLTFDNSDELEMIMQYCSAAIRPVLSTLCQFNAYWSKDPMQLTAFGLTKSRQHWMITAGRSATMPVKGMLNRIFSVLASLAHSISLLKFHGIGPFYHNMLSFQSAHSATSEKGARYERMIIDSEPFKQMMTRMQFWINNPTFVGHPKLEEVQNLVVTHFLNVGRDTPSRIMIFTAFRDSAEEIVRILKRNSPEVRPHIFVGQAASKRSEGMDQKTQLDIIEKFKDGTHNVLVATSIGEEGLDIGQVDLIICYDSSSSPIRMLQRMGRTGRKRAGRIILLLMRGKEEESFKSAKDAYEKIQGMIEDGRRFKFHDDLSPRILPREAKPVADKRRVEIPAENSQLALVEPRKGRAKATKKKPAKNYYMPDDVQTGFVSASGLGADGQPAILGLLAPAGNKGRGRATAKKATLAGTLDVAPPAEDVFLSSAELRELDRNYRNVHIGGGERNGVEICAPAVTLHAVAQRQLRPTKHVSHGQASRRFAKTLARMHDVDGATLQRWKNHAAAIDLDKLCGHIQLPEPMAAKAAAAPKKRTAAKPKPKVMENTAPEMPPAGAASTDQQTRARRGTRGRATLAVGGSSDSEGMEAASSSPAPTPSGMGLPTQGEELGSQDTEGEDEQEAEMDSELAGWIVGSDEEIEVEASSAPTFASIRPAPRSRTEVTELFTSDEHDGAHDKGDAGRHDRAAKRRRRLVVDDDSEGE